MLFPLASPWPKKDFVRNLMILGLMETAASGNDTPHVPSKKTSIIHCENLIILTKNFPGDEFKSSALHDIWSPSHMHYLAL